MRGGSDLGGNALVATKDGRRRRELAAPFLAFVTEREQMRAFCAAPRLLPTRADLVDEASTSRSDPSCRRCSSARPHRARRRTPEQVASPQMAKINTVLQDQLEKAFVGGQSTDDTIAGLAAGIEQACSLT